MQPRPLPPRLKRLHSAPWDTAASALTTPPSSPVAPSIQTGLSQEVYWNQLGGLAGQDEDRDDGVHHPAKRIRTGAYHLEPSAFALLSLSSPLNHPIPGPPLVQLPTPAAGPVAMWPNVNPASTTLPVTPPLQQGPLHLSSTAISAYPPEAALVEVPEVRMKNTSSYDVNPHVVHIESLDSDSDEEEVQGIHKQDKGEDEARQLEVHPSLLAPLQLGLPSPLPPEILAHLQSTSASIRNGGDSRALILYKPLGFGGEPAGMSAKGRELERRALAQQAKDSVPQGQSPSLMGMELDGEVVGLTTVHEGDGESMEID